MNTSQSDESTTRLAALHMPTDLVVDEERAAVGVAVQVTLVQWAGNKRLSHCRMVALLRSLENGCHPGSQKTRPVGHQQSTTPTRRRGGYRRRRMHPAVQPRRVQCGGARGDFGGIREAPPPPFPDLASRALHVAPCSAARTSAGYATARATNLRASCLSAPARPNHRPEFREASLCRVGSTCCWKRPQRSWRSRRLTVTQGPSAENSTWPSTSSGSRRRTSAAMSRTGALTRTSESVTRTRACLGTRQRRRNSATTTCLDPRCHSCPSCVQPVGHCALPCLAGGLAAPSSPAQPTHLPPRRRVGVEAKHRKRKAHP